MDTLEVKHAFIQTLEGSWGSGLATLVVKAAGTGEVVRLHADNGPLVRALDSAFDIITPGHTFDARKLSGQKITYWLDEFGLCLGGFVPGFHDSADIFQPGPDED